MLNGYIMTLWIGAITIEKAYQWKSQRLKPGDKHDRLNTDTSANFFLKWFLP